MVRWKQQTFYLVGGYYIRRDGKALHRLVWEDAYGPQPPGHHIHHRDGDRTNNDLENLVLLTAAEHKLIHSVPKANDWHRSDEGRAWHREHAVAQWNDPKMTKLSCQFCGEPFMSPMSDAKFCSSKCKQAKARDERRYGVDALCVICGDFFRANKYRPAKTCSRSCAQSLRWSASKRTKEEPTTR